MDGVVRMCEKRRKKEGGEVGGKIRGAGGSCGGSSKAGEVTQTSW